jgi:hypothetical protein
MGKLADLHPYLVTPRKSRSWDRKFFSTHSQILNIWVFPQGGPQDVVKITVDVSVLVAHVGLLWVGAAAASTIVPAWAGPGQEKLGKFLGKVGRFFTEP